EVARVIAAFDRDLAHRAGHGRYGELDGAFRQPFQILGVAQLRRQALQRLPCARPVEQHAPVEQRLAQAAQHEVGIRDGERLPALAVAGWPRYRAGAAGADLERAVDVDPGDAAAARADRVDVHLRRIDGHAGDDVAGREQRLQLLDQADV